MPLRPPPKKPSPRPSPRPPGSLPAAKPPPVEAGDAHWLRVMETKEAQYRLLNTLALHELHTRERAACEELDALSTRLKTVSAAADGLAARLALARGLRARQQYVRVAAPSVGRLCEALERVKGVHEGVCEGVLREGRVLRVEGGCVEGEKRLLGELERFREVAGVFRERCEGLEVLGVVEGVEELAGVVRAESGAVSCAAEAVCEAAGVVECERAVMVGRIVEGRGNELVTVSVDYE